MPAGGAYSDAMEYAFIIAFMAYLMPWVLAEAIEHRNATAIGVLTFGLGWTGVGWFAAAAWVARDWPRAAAPAPRLLLVASAEGADRIEAPRLRRWPRSVVALFAALGIVGAGVALRTAWQSPIDPEWTHARVTGAPATLRMGPDARWPARATLGADCRVRVLERRGAWRRVWRLEACGADGGERAGWVRVEALRGVDPNG